MGFGKISVACLSLTRIPRTSSVSSIQYFNKDLLNLCSLYVAVAEGKYGYRNHPHSYPTPQEF